MKTVIPILIALAAVDLFIRIPNKEEQISVFDELKTKSVSELQIYLDEAVEQERYEIACVIRDLINEKLKKN